MTTQQIAAYLERINMAEPKEPTLEYLTELQMAHISSIPFENLDFRRNVPVELDGEHLFKKIID